MLQKNTASQKLYIQALDADGIAVTGDAANLSCKVKIDHGSATALANSASAAEVEDGVYSIDLTQAETNGDHLLFLPESSTSGVEVIVIGGENGRTDSWSAAIAAKPSAATIRDAVWEADFTGYVGATMIAARINDIHDTADAIQVDTAEIGAGGAGLDSIPWNSAWDAEVESECTDAIVAINNDSELQEIEADLIAAAILDALAADHNDANTFGALLNTILVGVNVASINDVTVAGAGTSGDKWRA